MIKRKNKLDIALFIGYVFFAGAATIVDFALLYCLTEYVGIHYFFSAMISYITGMITNYTLNKAFNFKNKSKNVIKQFGLFAIVALIGLAINQIIITLLVEKFQVMYLLAKVASVSVVMIWSYIGHKNITFKYLK